MDPGSDNEAHDDGLTVPADVAQLALLRSYVAARASESGAPDEIVEQFELVVSELATNVIHHSDAEDVTVTFHRVTEGWAVDVSNADGIDELGTPTLPDPAELSGRGLYLVHAVMDAVDLIEVDDGRHIRCIKHGA